MVCQKFYFIYYLIQFYAIKIRIYNFLFYINLIDSHFVLHKHYIEGFDHLYKKENSFVLRIGRMERSTTSREFFIGD